MFFITKEIYMEIRKFKRVLVANRGEIAIRILRACKELGIRGVAVYSEEDKNSLFRTKADEAYQIGRGKSPVDAYLSIDGIIELAKAKGVDAIHPGYGFLSENTEFARACEEAGIVFIGPDCVMMDSLGDKVKSKIVAAKAGVPTIPGIAETIPSVEVALEFAEKCGYPVMLKAAAGGGGRGMRIVRSKDELPEQFESARSEARKAFGIDDIFIEKYIERPKHIEVQVLGDNYGNIVHLYERDCSIQRRHQKLIEESPSPAISDEQRKKMGEIAVKAAKAAEYYSAGTIEFLRDKHGDFYFIEMNTRIQVEHPVTEWVTGIDLIREQIRIAAGKHLTYTQEDVHVHGHAIEVRINAEDTEHDFRPSPGTVTNVHFPGGKGVRIDSALFAGYQIPPYYDSMIAKLIVYDKNRKLALRKLRNALGELVLEGVKTNIDYQYEIINDEDFIEGNVDTGFIERFQKKHQSENEAE